jgi:hypothetical protein
MLAQRPTLSSQLSFDQLSQQLSAQEYFSNQKLIQDYLQSQQPFVDPVVVDNDSTPFMTGVYDFANPAIRIQQSTPTPHMSAGFAQSAMQPSSATDWNSYANSMQNTQSLQTPRTGKTHQRASSSSSIGSNGSHYQAAAPTASYMYVGYPENLPSLSALGVDSSYSASEPPRAYSNHLPTPTHTPTQDTFMNNYNSFASNNSNTAATMAAHMAMKQALMDQSATEDDVPGFADSTRHSVSSYGHDSPATPRTAHGEDFDDKFKMPPTGKTLRRVDSWLFDQFLAYDDELDMRHTVPKFERTYTDAAVDNFYDPNTMIPQAQSNHMQNSSLLSPYRNNDIVQRTLQAAQNARSQSPSASTSRGVSPFRQNSPFRQPSTGLNSPAIRVGTAAHAREQNRDADAAYAMKQNVASSEDVEPKTISPKDALLDYREADEDSKVPLFPDGGASEYEPQYNGGDQYRNATQPNFDTTSGTSSYQRDSWATPQFSPNFSTASGGSSQPTSSFTFVAPPAHSGNAHNGLPYTPASLYRSTTNSMPSASDQVPEFPAHLTSMESSASEAEPQNSQNSTEYLQKPAASAADSGTYTCTYHGCTQRFETPQKLQKHKRDAHRNANPAVISAAMTSAALLERNSQAGPHKCERTNPTTGKPCNTIFSRPYDLTRHEDTIHNARKQKVRCALCVEEKTFSRNDALTRHMVRLHHQRSKL